MGTKKGNLGCNFCFGNKHYQDQDFKAMKLLHNPMGIDQLSFNTIFGLPLVDYWFKKDVIGRSYNVRLA